MFIVIELFIVLRSKNLQTIRKYKSLKKPEFFQMQQRNQTRSLWYNEQRNKVINNENITHFKYQ